MVEQVIGAKRYLESIGDPAPVTGAVFMGMGEPFDNYDRCDVILSYRRNFVFFPLIVPVA